MKPTKITIWTALALLVSLTACDKYLDLEPRIGETEANYYQTADDAMAALTAAYDPLQWNFTTSVFHFRWIYGDIMSDDALKGGSGPNDQPQMEALSHFTHTAGNIHVNASYEAKYQGIYRANTVLEKVPAIEMDADLKERILAEAKFLRGYYYFELVTLFGGVPLVDRRLAPSEYNLPRASEADIWEQIETDLSEAAAVLPEKSEYGAADAGRATRGAALALLGKAHVYQQEWPEAVAALGTVVSSMEYDLEPNFTDVFDEVGENGIESVFEIQRYPGAGGHWGNVNQSSEGTLTNVFQTARGAYSGWGFNLPTQDLVDEFEANDPRLGQTIFMEGDTMGDRGVFTTARAGSDYPYYSRKYFIDFADRDRAVGDININGLSNDRVIRFADVLLLYAEALAEDNQDGLAQDVLERVRARARAGQNPLAVLPRVNATGQALIDAIYHERRVELAMEGHRFFDLVRTGRAANVMQAFGEPFVAGTHELMPIPTKQIQLNPAMANDQNPGYN